MSSQELLYTSTKTALLLEVNCSSHMKRTQRSYRSFSKISCSSSFVGYYTRTKTSLILFLTRIRTFTYALETISGDECIYDSSKCGIPEENKIFAIGNTEKSLISFAVTHNELFTASVLGDEFENDFMYRRYLHMGEKPNCLNDYIEFEGSTMWHAINTKMLPQPLSKTMKSPMRIKRDRDLPF